MIVHSFHPFTRRYLGPLTLDDSDRSPLEPDVWHIPGNCLAAAPPTPGAGQYAAEEAGAWVLRDIPPEPEPPEPVPMPEPEPPTREQRRQQLEFGIQGYVDSVARMLGYDSMATAVTYADEPAVPRFQAEGQALRAWRSLVWAACHAHPAFADDSVDLPTLEEAIALLPLFTPPEVV